jgi:hypothetical protein
MNELQLDPKLLIEEYAKSDAELRRELFAYKALVRQLQSQLQERTPESEDDK